jgi:hypothetical protein
MTDERIRELMKAKGFWQRPLSPTFLRVYPRFNTCIVEQLADDTWGVTTHRVLPRQRTSSFVEEKVSFANPIAAATYAERHIIPALLAGKESA